MIHPLSNEDSPAYSRRAFFALGVLAPVLALAGCSTDELPFHQTTPTVIGSLQNPAIRESSGLAASSHDAQLLWTLNDSGSGPVLYAIGIDASNRGAVSLGNASNRDWEDLAAGDGTLVVADIGDNLGIHPFVSLYVVNEPEAPLPESFNTRRVDFVYPDGPRDAEALAVDRDSNVAYILSKRTLPPELYSVPLDAIATDGSPVTAQAHGPIESLPGPGESPLPYHWQPTAMDFSADGQRAAVLTYEALYVYERSASQAWPEALRGKPKTYALAGILAAEAVALIGSDAFITVEGQGTPLYRITLGTNQ